ncbi:MAG: oligosaccharide flippase family protein [Eubacteriales bacterium]|nr:oligosaccharide flippase family protein [Eubacteriales bacterium]
MKNILKSSLIKGTLILTAAAIISKLFGFYYRIFLTRYIGSYGLGLITLTMPVYSIAFSLFMGGFNSCISHFTSAQGDKKDFRYLSTATLITLPLSILFSIICYSYSDRVAERIILNPECSALIKILCFQIPFSVLHNCICGYYYGCQKTTVPAISQIIEQMIRILSVIIYCRFTLSQGKNISVTYALYGNIVGEISACLYCICAQLITHKKENKKPLRPHIKDLPVIIKYTIPLNLNSLLIHLLESGESILVPAQLIIYGMDRTEALSLFGVLTGMAMPLIMFPTAITNSLSVMLLPKVSNEQGQNDTKKISSTINKTVKLCAHLGIMCSLLFLVYASKLGSIIFEDDRVCTFTTMLSLLCPFLYLKVNLTSILNGLSKTGSTCTASVIGQIIRISCLIGLVPRIGLDGYIYGIIVSNIIVCVILFMKLKFTVDFKISLSDSLIIPVSLSVISVISSKIITDAGYTLISSFMTIPYQSTSRLVLGGIIATVIYGVFYIFFIKKDENKKPA